MSTSTSTAVNKQSGSSKPSSGSIPTGQGFQVQVDPSLLVYGAGGHDLPIDPALFAIEQVVNDVRKGKIKPDVQDANQKEAATGAQHREASSSSMIGNSDPVPQHLGAVDTGLDILDEEFDPALREIVNSLTNAQQVCLCFQQRPSCHEIINPLDARQKRPDGLLNCSRQVYSEQT
jgi:hypothetical protein